MQNGHLKVSKFSDKKCDIINLLYNFIITYYIKWVWTKLLMNPIQH